MLRAILNKSWRQHQLYGHLPPITKTIQVRRTRHAGHCWRSGDELISDVLLWTPTYGRAKAGRPARTYIQQICDDTGCSPEDLSEAMNDREKWRERVRDIRASDRTWWWWWWWWWSCPSFRIFNVSVSVDLKECERDKVFFLAATTSIPLNKQSKPDPDLCQRVLLSPGASHFYPKLSTVKKKGHEANYSIKRKKNWNLKWYHDKLCRSYQLYKYLKSMR